MNLENNLFYAANNVKIILLLILLIFYLGVINVKKVLSAVLSVLMALSAFSVLSVNAAITNSDSAGAISFNTFNVLYAHAVVNSDDSEAWQFWQSEHDEDFNEINSDVKYFFLPTSADEQKVDIYNAFSQSVTVNGVSIASGETKTVNYNTGTRYTVNADGKTYYLEFMKSNAEAAIYINNSNADGNGTELMEYLNVSKSNSAKATGAIVDPSGSIDNTTIKKIKGRGNTTWDKPKKAYNITYDSGVSIAGMSKGKKYSILANYQDDSLSRNRFLYDLSDAVGMPYASDSRYVDFYVNGFYWGSYQMTEKVEAGKSSLVYDVDDSAYLNDDGTINEDFPFICEVDASAVEGDDYCFNSSSGNKITIKAPEISEGEPGYNEVKDYVKEKFDVFFDAIKNNSENLSDYADIDSVTKIYLINELGKNWDSGVSSLFFTYKQDENGNYKFYGSPVWDYDNSLGNATGVSFELNDIGVNDYEEYSGWWCKYKGKRAKRKSSSNIMNNIARNEIILSAAPKIWFEEFVPAIDNFANGQGGNTSDEMYTADDYYNLVKDSAEMNYKSGWLIYTGDWISDHSSLNKAHFDAKTGKCVVDSTVTNYSQDFDGMFNYCRDWLVSRAAWLSGEMIADYNPPVGILGDVNSDGRISILDATAIQKYCVSLITLTENQIKLGDTNGDGRISVLDATEIQKYLVDLPNALKK